MQQRLNFQRITKNWGVGSRRNTKEYTVSAGTKNYPFRSFLLFMGLYVINLNFASYWDVWINCKKQRHHQKRTREQDRSVANEEQEFCFSNGCSFSQQRQISWKWMEIKRLFIFGQNMAEMAWALFWHHTNIYLFQQRLFIFSATANLAGKWMEIKPAFSQQRQFSLLDSIKQVQFWTISTHF